MHSRFCTFILLAVSYHPEGPGKDTICVLGKAAMKPPRTALKVLILSIQHAWKTQLADAISTRRLKPSFLVQQLYISRTSPK